MELLKALCAHLNKTGVVAGSKVVARETRKSDARTLVKIAGRSCSTQHGVKLQVLCRRGIYWDAYIDALRVHDALVKIGATCDRAPSYIGADKDGRHEFLATFTARGVCA